MRSKWSSALAALVVACAPSVAHGALMGAPLLGGSDWPTGPLLGFGAFAGAPTSSYTRVREGTDRGTYLYLQDDLGIPVIGEAQVQLGWRITPDDAVAFAFGNLFTWGGTRLPYDIEYNAGTFQGGTRLESNAVRWFVLELQYEHALFRFMEENRGLLALDVGVRFDYMDWRFSKSTLAPTTIGRESGEDFFKQSNPIPLLGLTARFPIAPSWDVVAAARGFRLNHVSSGRSEGGIVYVSQSVIDATAGLAWRASEGVELVFGYRFLYVDIDEESTEDGNLVGVFSHGAFFTVQVVF